MKKFLFLFLFITSWQQAESQNIQWVSWERAIEQAKKENKKIFVDIYTEGCVPCRNLEITTFSQPCIINYINQYFVPVRIDARTRDKLNFKNASYEYVCEGGTCFNELVTQLTGGNLIFPSLVFIDENQNIIQAIPNYKDPMTFERIMTYYGQNHYFTIPWTRFERNYKPQKCERRN